jgi:hypothetical protein
VFAWWGSHAKALRKRVERLASGFPSVRVSHVDHCNPAAMGDAFCEGDPFGTINAALGAQPIDWLPVRGWRAAHGETAQRMGAFVQETMELHQLYLERLQEVREEKLEELAAIEGIAALPAMAFSDAAAPLASLLPGLLPAVRAAEEYGRKAVGLFSFASKLSAHEAAAVHLYTMQSALYRQLNASLRHEDRARSRAYFPYLRLLLSALDKLEAFEGSLWRGVGMDLQSQYPAGRVVTWWGVSSCTPRLEVAKSFLGGKGRRTLFEVVVRRAVSIKKYSAFTGEDEYVLAPGTQLRVADVRAEGDGLTRVRLEELSGPRRVA